MNDDYTYKQVIEEIADTDNHLLIANGFNSSLGIFTSYKNIFEEMMSHESGGHYSNAQTIIEDCNYDLEKFIGIMLCEIDDGSIFLRNFVSNKIKLDFMKATQKIVKSNIKKVYSNENKGVYILLSKFSNYFTLNYDPFLYLLLLNFKKYDDTELSLAMQPNMQFIEEELNKTENNIFSEIKDFKKNGSWTIKTHDIEITLDMSKITKADFISNVVKYSESKGFNWKKQHINVAVSQILREERGMEIISFSDGFKKQILGGQMNIFGDPYYDLKNITQNLFFLHGAFHIYETNKKYYKITQCSDKALYEKLEVILNDENSNICSIFRPDNKIDEIVESEYLSNGLNKLKKLKGNLVVIGSSLDKNDDHIFRAINDSEIDTVYVSYYKDYNEKLELSRNCFSKKKVILFDAETISYSL